MADLRSQKAEVRPIAFRLDDGQGSVTTVPLVIRPEDLQRTEPALQTATQTLGGAFLDGWGPGLTEITISGHTGWGAGGRVSGFDAFQNLHDAVWSKWHKARADAAQSGRSPTTVKLTFIDDLDEICVLVAPGQMQLLRNRQRPLLMMYRIPMTVLSEQIQDATVDPLDLSGAPSAVAAKNGIDSLAASVSRLQTSAANVRSFVDANMVSPLHGLLTTATAGLNKVMSVASAARGVVTSEVSQFSGMAADLAQVGRNVFNTYNAIATLSDFSAHEVTNVAAEFGNAFCVLRNAFRPVREYPDFEGIYGASNCSSTVGGSPISPLIGGNAWESILDTPASVASITPDAKAQIDILKTMDPVLSPMSMSELGSRTSVVVSGVTFPWL